MSDSETLLVKKYVTMKDNLTKDIFVNNLELLFGKWQDIKAKKDTTRIRVLMKATHSTRVCAVNWPKRSNSNMPPLSKMCDLCLALHIGLESLMTDRQNWREKVKQENIPMYEVAQKLRLYSADSMEWKIADIMKAMNDDEQAAIEYMTVVKGVYEDYITEKIREYKEKKVC